MRVAVALLFPSLLGISLALAVEQQFDITSAPHFVPLKQAAYEGTPRIVGGTAARPGQFPWQVGLLRSGGFTCGGSLIATRWVLSAAHCVMSGNTVAPPSQFTVIAGTVNLNQGGTRRGVRRIIAHENYGNFRNDLSLLELSEAVATSSGVQPIALARSPAPAGSVVTISGWGRLYTNGPLPSTLQYNKVTTLSQRQCASTTGIRSGLMCLVSPANNGACNGDSGGPAVYNNQLVGVANFVINYCGSTAPDGYAQVSDFVRWVETKIN